MSKLGREQRKRFKEARRKSMAMKCPLCADDRILPLVKDKIAEHLIVTRDHDNHFHVHGPIGNRAVIQEFVTFVLKEAGIAFDIVRGPERAEKKGETGEDRASSEGQQQEE